MLRRNIEHFLKKRIYKKLGISEMEQPRRNIFFLFLTVCAFDFCKNMNEPPSLHVVFD